MIAFMAGTIIDVYFSKETAPMQMIIASKNMHTLL